MFTRWKWTRLMTLTVSMAALLVMSPGCGMHGSVEIGSDPGADHPDDLRMPDPTPPRQTSTTPQYE